MATKQEHLQWALENLKTANEAVANALIELNNVLTASNGESPEVPSNSDKHDAFLADALTYLNVPYVWGGQNRQGVDCSGLVVAAMLDIGVDFADRTSEMMYQQFPEVKSVKDGDLIIFKIETVGDHVGIRNGYQHMLHAPEPGDVVKITDISTDWWQERIVAVVCPFGEEH